MTKTALSAAVSSTFKEQRLSNPIKGAKYREYAIEFAKIWPVGSGLTWEEFCDWAFTKGLLDFPQPTQEELRSEGKQSDVWLAHLQRRHQVKQNLNKASQHSDMISHGGAFSIESVRGKLLVKDVASVIAQCDVATRINSLAQTKTKQLDYLYQSTDWATLPPHERALAEALRDDLDDWVMVIDLQAKQHEKKFAKLTSRVKHLVDSGSIHPTNGGISGLLTNDD